MNSQLSLDELLAAIAAKSPTPGGGAVASITAALAAALAQMVVRYSQGKKKLADFDQIHADSLAQLEAFAQRALKLAESDAAAYGRLSELWRLEKDDPTRQREWAGAVEAAIDAPRRVVQLCGELLDLLAVLVGKTSAMLNSDLAIAAVLAEAAARAGAWNVRINLPLIEDGAKGAALEKAVATQVQRACTICRRIEGAMAES